MTRIKKSVSQKTLSLLLVLSLMLCLVPPLARAEGVTDSLSETDLIRIESLLRDAEQNADLYEININDTLYLGNEIKAYKMEPDAQRLEIQYFPVFSGDVVVAMITKYGDPSAPSFGFSKELACGLQEFLQRNKNIALLRAVSQPYTIFYAVSDNEIFELQRVQLTSNEDKDNINENLPQQSNITNYVDIDEVYPTYERVDVLSESNANVEMPFPVPVNFAPYSFVVPAVSQGSDPICWAACISSIAKYMKNMNLTPRQVCDAAGLSYTPASISKIAGVMNEVCGIFGTAVSDRAYVIENMISLIGNGKPVLTGFANTSSFNDNIAHAVVVYDIVQTSSSTVNVKYMDPSGGVYSSVNVANAFANPTLKIVYGSIEYGYFAHVKLL